MRASQCGAASNSNSIHHSLDLYAPWLYFAECVCSSCAPSPNAHVPIPQLNPNQTPTMHHALTGRLAGKQADSLPDQGRSRQSAKQRASPGPAAALPSLATSSLTHPATSKKHDARRRRRRRRPPSPQPRARGGGAAIAASRWRRRAAVPAHAAHAPGRAGAVGAVAVPV